MKTSVLLVTPPFTQINTPYPATAYLKGFLNTLSVSSFQIDLGLEVILSILSKTGLTHLFQNHPATAQHPEACKRIYAAKHKYIQLVDDVILFLQGKNPTFAHYISMGELMPQADRFNNMADLQDSFGFMGIQDKAKYLSTLWIEDIVDYIKTVADDFFGFSRYAEKIAGSVHSFDELHATVNGHCFIDDFMWPIFKQAIEQHNPNLVCFTVPFPGNMYGALKCGYWIKQHYPSIKVALGGGYANTELRSLKDSRVFEFVDFITFDDGEAPIAQIIKYLEGHASLHQLKRTFIRESNQVVWVDDKQCANISMANTGTPDYTNLRLQDYIHLIEIINPMHTLWNDGRWNKLTMAHGCYWSKCTFCDVSLPYISDYEPLNAIAIVDRMETIIAQTKQTGFHFVDEAAPPTLMKQVAIEILRRNLNVTWWTNIRFEKSFTRDTCLLLKASGCIGVSGGLEVASDRLLQLINKGITVAQVAKVNKHFTEAGIMVHAYLMYGFPTQTDQETIDSLEMVRQMFLHGVLKSAFWHIFTLTIHSPVGKNPDAFNVQIVTDLSKANYAQNDVKHIDSKGADHEQYAFGLKKSLHNFMHGQCLDFPLQKWFDFKIPKTTVSPNFIEQVLQLSDEEASKSTSRVIFCGKIIGRSIITKSKKGNTWTVLEIEFYHPIKTFVIQLPQQQGEWWLNTLQVLDIEHQHKKITLGELQTWYEAAGLEHFDLFWYNKPINQMYQVGLWVI